MAKIVRTYSLDADVVAGIKEYAAAQRTTASALVNVTMARVVLGDMSRNIQDKDAKDEEEDD